MPRSRGSREPAAKSGGTSTERIVEELRHAILEGVLRPGKRLRAETLASQFGSSRTPVREALLRLEVEGLVEVQPRRGAVVRPFDAADLLDLYEVRTLLEPYAAARAATRIDAAALERLKELCTLAAERDSGERASVQDQIAWNHEFHLIIRESADSPRVLAAMRTVTKLPRAFEEMFWSSDELRTHSLFCHREIVHCLEAGAPERAETAMRLHLSRAWDFLAAEIGPDTPDDRHGNSPMASRRDPTR